jgi:hypothetical protein
MTAKNTIANFWAKVDKTPGHGPDGECWVWTAAKKSGGYGHFGFHGRIYMAHRFIYEWLNGTLEHSDGFHGPCVCHRCDNPSCVRPDHLFAAPGQVNKTDSVQKRRHIFGVANVHAVLDDNLVIEIRRAAGTNADVAAAFGVSASTISYVRNRRTWRHVVNEGVFA